MTLSNKVDKISSIKDDILNCHTSIIENLNNKGITATKDDKLSTLINKISYITAESLGGTKISTGTFTQSLSYSTSAQTTTINYTPGFVPSYVFVIYGEFTTPNKHWKGENATFSNLYKYSYTDQYITSLEITDITDTSFKINYSCIGASSPLMWIAIK